MDDWFDEWTTLEDWAQQADVIEQVLKSHPPGHYVVQKPSEFAGTPRYKVLAGPFTTSNDARQAMLAMSPGIIDKWHTAIIATKTWPAAE